MFLLISDAVVSDVLQIIRRIRDETEYIGTLDPPLRQIAVDCYAMALRAVFLCQTAVAVCTLLACLPIEENPLPSVQCYAIFCIFKSDHDYRGSHEEQDEQDRRRREIQVLRHETETENGTAAD